MKYHSISKTVVTILFQSVAVCISVNPVGLGSTTSAYASLLGGDAMS